ncbi:MAG: arginine--tRNA ligase [Caldilineae bacterium]|nr:MAG: arginine--tRNA ligase [Caldilineae bacterium]
MMLPDQIADLITTATRKAQKKGDLPRFQLPSVSVNRPKRPEQGDWSCALPLQIVRDVNEALKARDAGKLSPVQIGEIIVRRLPDNPYLERVEVVKPGFINMFLSPEWLAAQAGEIVARGADYYRLDKGQGKRVQVEFVSANPTGPLHFGGARNAAIGDTIARLLENNGYRVQREYYINDRGTQMDIFGETLWRRYQQLHGIEVSIPEQGYPGAYMIEYARKVQAQYGDSLLSLSDEEAIPKFRKLGLEIVTAELADDLAQMQVHFDNWFSESSLYEDGTFDHVAAILRENGDLYVKDDAVWFRASKYLPKSDRDEVFIRSNGEPGYYASDVAYHYNKFVTRGFDWVINVWAVDHQNQAARMPAMLKALGIDPDRLTIVLYDLVTLKRGGKEVKISKRSGELITMREVLDEVGSDAARFLLLSHSNEARIDFDIELAVAQNSENPVYYVQYAHARVSSILRKAAAQGLEPDDAELNLLTHPTELALLHKMLQLPEVVNDAIDRLAPHHLPHYALELAKTFTKFYDACRVLSDDPADAALSRARLTLVKATQITLAYLLHLMGMNAPESM